QLAAALHVQSRGRRQVGVSHSPERLRIMNYHSRLGPRRVTCAGHTHAVGDAGARAEHIGTRASDPTGTLPLQREFIREMRNRWNNLSKIIPTIMKARLDPPAQMAHVATTGEDPVR